MQTISSLPLSDRPVSTMTGDKARLISLDLYTGSRESLLRAIMQAARRRESRGVCFANVPLVVAAQRDPAVAAAVNRVDWITADGVPLTWAMRALYGIRPERIAGMAATDTLLRLAAQQQIPVFFYGSTPEVHQRTWQLCRVMYPTLSIVGMVAPPFRPATPAEDEAIIADITASGAGLVFVSLGCPEKERWIARMQDRIPAVLLGVGGALPVLAGYRARAPRLIQQAGLEWLFRLVQAPSRLGRRYAFTNPLFGYYLLRQWLSGR